MQVSASWIVLPPCAIILGKAVWEGNPIEDYTQQYHDHDGRVPVMSLYLDQLDALLSPYEGVPVEDQPFAVLCPECGFTLTEIGEKFRFKVIQTLYQVDDT